MMKEEQLEREQQDSQLDASRQYPYLAQGDVTNGSVDYYDFDWGDEVLYEPEEVSYSCSEGCPYEGCPGPCGPHRPSPDPDPCVPQVPDQVDDPIYEIVDP